MAVRRDDAGQQTDSAPHSDPKGSIVLSASCQGIGADTRDGTGLQARWPGRIRQQRQLSICGRASLHSRYSNIGVLLSDRLLILLWRVVVQYVGREHSSALSGSTVRADSTNQERPSAISAEHGNICTQSAKSSLRCIIRPIRPIDGGAATGRKDQGGWMQNVQETDCMRAGRCIGGMAMMAMAMVLYRRRTLSSWQAVTVPSGLLSRLRPILAMLRSERSPRRVLQRPTASTLPNYSVYRDTRAGLARVTRVEEAGTPMLNSTEVLFTEC
ncbi:hypothetical protein OIDMADRAFT_32972 [Oidiodendron maius Zn]|uniref:Uncharacterized protein n=1 Tax=Oidiodendron maius (strain Zn) TaxID=913774 RepID=A0A0C3GYP8_OIDMZ|nr:hypothetical protein OIDMADRAFT_32972 [Oidiodendron maius Zn]